jgi:hypothetical protein
MMLLAVPRGPAASKSAFDGESFGRAVPLLQARTVHWLRSLTIQVAHGCTSVAALLIEVLGVKGGEYSKKS